MSGNLINSISTRVLKARLPRIRHYMEFPWETQDDVFWRLLEMGSFSAFGVEHNFREISSIADFRAKIAIRSYEELYPWIGWVLKGEDDVLWPGPVRWFSKSSGTTNDRSKYIPITRESLHDCHYKAGKDMLAVYMDQKSGTEMFTGKGLSIGGSHEINQANPKASFGDLSSVLIQNMPFFFEQFRAPSLEAALLGEWEEKIERIAAETANENVTSISGVPTWTMVLMNRLFELKGITDRNLNRLWPNLEVFFHGGVSFKPYRSQFEAMDPAGKISWLETYNASEGFFAFQDDLTRDDLLLLLDYGIFYEFIPLEYVGQEHPETLSLHEVESGRNYALVISTNGGLWRYLVGDTIAFTTLNPYRIKVTGRTKHFINAFGEELVVENADSAIEYASRKTSSRVENYTAAPVYFEGTANGAHEWLIEFSSPQPDIATFMGLLDEKLKELNSDYHAKRHKDIALRMPVVRFLKPGTFYGWMKMRGKLGGQNKVPRLSNDRTYVESILAM